MPRQIYNLIVTIPGKPESKINTISPAENNRELTRQLLKSGNSERVKQFDGFCFVSSVVLTVTNNKSTINL